MQEINIFSLIEHQETYTKKFSTGQLKNLPQVKNSSFISEVQITIKGIIEFNHGRKNRLISIAINGDIELICERCNNAIKHTINIQNTLEVFSSIQRLEKIDIADENYDSIVGSTAFNIQELLEEEILLSLPPFPTHEVCPKHDYYIKPQDIQSPFAILAQLKKNSNA